VEATATAGLDGADVPNMMGFRNGYWNMINSMSVEFNNQTIVQQTPFLNVFRSFKAHTFFSESDVINHGNEIGYALDTASSWGYDTADDLSEKGVYNNEYAPPTSGHALTTNWDLGSHNEGLRKRMENTYKFPSGKGKTGVVTDATRGLLYQSRCVSKSATSVVWEVYAKLRLKEITDYFEKVPLLKGSTMRFLVNTNQAEVSIAPTTNTLRVAQASVLSGNTFPLMVTSQKDTTATASGGKSTLGTNAVRLSVDIVKSRQNGHQTSLTSCRLYAPLYKLNPLEEQRYLSLSPSKRVEYEDVSQYQFTGVNAGDTFNIFVSNGIADIQSVLGRNASAQQISLMIFVAFKRSITVDIQTGARLS